MVEYLLHPWPPALSFHNFGPEWSFSATTLWLTMKLCLDINVSQRFNPDDCGDALVSALPTNQSLQFLSKIYVNLYRHNIWPKLVSPHMSIFYASDITQKSKRNDDAFLISLRSVVSGPGLRDRAGIHQQQPSIELQAVLQHTGMYDQHMINTGRLPLPSSIVPALSLRGPCVSGATHACSHRYKSCCLLLCVHTWPSGFSEWPTIAHCVNNWNKVISAVSSAN